MAKSNLQTVPDSTTLITRVKNNFHESILTTRNCMEDLAPIIAQAAAHMIQALLSDRKILICGNGGSAAEQHFSAELLNRFERERPGLPAISLRRTPSALCFPKPCGIRRAGYFKRFQAQSGKGGGGGGS